LSCARAFVAKYYQNDFVKVTLYTARTRRHHVASRRI